MSGDLKHPSKAIPKGTLYGLALTFSAYTLVILAMAASITRGSMYRNVNVIQEVCNASPFTFISMLICYRSTCPASSFSLERLQHRYSPH